MHRMHINRAQNQMLEDNGYVFVMSLESFSFLWLEGLRGKNDQAKWKELYVVLFPCEMSCDGRQWQRRLFYI